MLTWSGQAGPVQKHRERGLWLTEHMTDDSYAGCLLQTVHQARIEQANGSSRAGAEERVLPDHKASLLEKDAELQVHVFPCTQQISYMDVGSKCHAAALLPCSLLLPCSHPLCVRVPTVVLSGQCYTGCLQMGPCRRLVCMPKEFPYQHICADHGNHG